jgi:hypothetical protein
MITVFIRGQDPEIVSGDDPLIPEDEPGDQRRRQDPE